VTTTEVITGSGPAIQVDVVLAENRGLVCDGGLRVNLANTTAVDIPSGRSCANILRRSTTGALHALVPEAIRVEEIPSVLRSIPNNGTASGTSHTTTVTNNTGCEGILLVRGQFQINWEVEGDLDDPFNALFKMALKRNGTNVDVQYLTVGGLKPVAGDCFHKSWRDIFWMDVMPAGASWTFTDECVHLLDDGAGQRRNVAANIATTPPDFSRGYRTVFDAVILPIGVA